MAKGKPLRDGSGKGVRANENRGGCRDGEVCDVSDIIQRQYRNRRAENA